MQIIYMEIHMFALYSKSCNLPLQYRVVFRLVCAGLVLVQTVN